jgi:hypothetical protein
LLLAFQLKKSTEKQKQPGMYCPTYRCHSDPSPTRSSLSLPLSLSSADLLCFALRTKRTDGVEPNQKRQQCHGITVATWSSFKSRLSSPCPPPPHTHQGSSSIQDPWLCHPLRSSRPRARTCSRTPPGAGGEQHMKPYLEERPGTTRTLDASDGRK